MDKIKYWLEYYGMPKENIYVCATMIAQGYGVCRYLDGVKTGAEAIIDSIEDMNNYGTKTERI